MLPQQSCDITPVVDYIVIDYSPTMNMLSLSKFSNWNIIFPESLYAWFIANAVNLTPWICPLASHPQLLAFLLKSKSCLTSSRIFQLVLYLSSSVNLSSGSTYIQNPAAFQALLCDLEVNAHSLVVQLQEVDPFPRPSGRHLEGFSQHLYCGR